MREAKARRELAQLELNLKQRRAVVGDALNVCDRLRTLGLQRDDPSARDMQLLRLLLLPFFAVRLCNFALSLISTT